uniref:RNA polymerase II-associated protein 3 n=1 Tax=Homalodisca liturata TaxID=320908 RepID=A0A1B6HH32_9HEMI
MADPVFIQKQVKDNTEDLHNFVRDLKLWEEEMKRKDRQLSNDQKEEIFPPVRRAKISNNVPTKKPNSDNITKKRIPSYDYKTWDQFDVDKACEEIDTKDNKSESEDENENEEEKARQEEKYKKEMALYEKEIGNKHVKAGKWDEAIESYSRAIAAYSRDPIFYANRALCYLKKKKFQAAEMDCEASLKLDSTYVKAYLRCAAAHEALCRYEDARHKLRCALQLEPNNVQAQRDLERLTNQVTKNPIKESETKQSEAKVQKQDNEKEPESVAAKQINVTNKILENSKTEPVKECRTEPNWQHSDSTILPISKPPHLRSKKPLKRIEIHDVGLNMPKHVCVRLAQVKPQDLPGTSESSMSSSPAQSSTGPKPRSILTLNPSSSTCKGLPPPPKTSVQFHISWNGIKSDNKLCYQFLKQIPGEELPEIFKESLESRTFTSIVQILALEFTAAGDEVLPYLQGLAKVRRFSTLVLFMSPADKTNLTTLFDYCTQKTEASPDEIARLRKLYELL